MKNSEISAEMTTLTPIRYTHSCFWLLFVVDAADEGPKPCISQRLEVSLDRWADRTNCLTHQVRDML